MVERYGVVFMLSAKVEGSFFHKTALVPLRYGVMRFEVVSFC